jgi:hypothetical protein
MTTPSEALSAQKNALVTDWSKDLVAEIKGEIGKLKAVDKGGLHKSIRRKVKRQYGDPEAVTVFYRWYGGFIIPGVGKSYPLKKVKGMNASLNPRKPRDWYNSIAEKNTIILADKLAGMHADAYVNNLKI